MNRTTRRPYIKAYGTSNGFYKMRLRADMTQQEAAEKLEICKSTISMWENGKSSPRSRKIMKVAELYGCTVGELLEEFAGLLGRGSTVKAAYEAAHGRKHEKQKKAGRSVSSGGDMAVSDCVADPDRDADIYREPHGQ